MVPALGDLNSAIKKALSPEIKYPHSPGNLETPTTPNPIGDIKALGFKDYQTLLTFLNAACTGVVDDNELLIEHLIRLLAKLPPSSKEGKQMTDGLLGSLWEALNHPPNMSLGSEFKYRSADGSGNNINNPRLGAAGTAYARTVPSNTFQNPHQPDPAVIFDSLMSRGDNFEPHPQGISSMLFYLATIITHDIFQTSSLDHNINITSSYLDLAPLYGRSEDEVKAMRTFRNGLIKPDCFSSKRILGFPPGCGVMLIMFNRFHNYVAIQLARINENGRFNKPNSKLTGDPLDAAWKKYDEDLFQTGRLITCGLYSNIILKDYVRTILALNRTESTWNLDPRSKAGRTAFSHPPPQAVGNQVSVEFNLIYRWHSIISQRDDQWTIDEFKRLLGGQDPSKAKLEEVLRALHVFERAMPDAPEERAFAGFTRHPDGTLDDDSLVNILKESVKDIAGSFGANRVPDCMKTIEVLGIMQARYWNVATLNEFRAFMGLTKHTSFEDINPDPAVAKKLRDLYDSPDSVELYPGIVSEKAKPPMSPGSGLCVNYTTSKAILSDAVALIRGDRFYTVDYTPKNLTNWGFNEASYDDSINQGHVISKLIFRAFPNHFAQDSIYAHFPFVVPSENKKIHDDLGTAAKYSWEPPKRRPDPVVIRSYKAAMAILFRKNLFKPVWNESILLGTHLADGHFEYTFLLSGDKALNGANRSQITKALRYPPSWAEEIRTFCETKTTQLLEKYTIPFLSGTGGIVREVDIVRDVVSLATTHAMAVLFNLPLKTASNPHGIYTEQKMCDVLCTIYKGIFCDDDVAGSFSLQQTAKGLAQHLGGAMINDARAGRILSGIAKKITQVVQTHANGYAGVAEPTMPSFGSVLVARIVDHAGTVEEAVWGYILMTACVGTATQTQMLSQCLDYFLGHGAEHLSELHRLANLDTRETDDHLMKYILEAIRIHSPTALRLELSPSTTTTTQTVTDAYYSIPSHHLKNPSSSPSPTPTPPLTPPSPLTPTQDKSNPSPGITTLTRKTHHHIRPGTPIILDLSAASHDPLAFPDPESVDLTRPLESYAYLFAHQNDGVGMDMALVMMVGVLKSILRFGGSITTTAGKKEGRMGYYRDLDGIVRGSNGMGLRSVFWGGEDGDEDADAEISVNGGGLLARVEGPRGGLKCFDAVDAGWDGQVRRTRGGDTQVDENDGHMVWSGLKVYMTADQSEYSPLPRTMRVRYPEPA